jgi:hypothetical protein
MTTMKTNGRMCLIWYAVRDVFLFDSFHLFFRWRRSSLLQVVKITAFAVVAPFLESSFEYIWAKTQCSVILRFYAWYLSLVP